MSLREITVGDVPVRALRVTYVGELGWELYCPTEYGARPVARRSGRRASAHGIVAGGYRAIDSLRLEKGYRVWGADITPDETPLRGRARLLRQARQGGGFIGREALREAKERGPRARLRCLLLEDPRSVALGNEPVRIGGEIRGPRHDRRLRLHGRALDRLRLPPARGRARRAAPRWTSSASGSGARSRRSRCSTRTASASAIEVQIQSSPETGPMKWP